MEIKKFFITVLLLLSVMSAVAQNDSWAKRVFRSVKHYLDSSVVKSVDSRYIVVPERPWQVIMRYNMDKMNLKMHSIVDDEDFYDFSIDWEPRLTTHTANNIGLWVGYRGYGLGYSFSLNKRTGGYFTIGAIGGNYGINLRLRTFNTNEFEASINDCSESDAFPPGHEDFLLESPIRVHSLMIDGYYMFNNKRFSYAAAYDQSTIQVRSAGSLMVGALWNAMSVRFDDDDVMKFLMHNVGAFKIRQGSLGAGYAYNWVPVKGLLVNMMFMPMLTLYNRQSVERFEFADIEEDVLYGSSENDTRWSRVTLNFNARASVTYNWDRYFLNIFGQWNNHNYDYGDDGNGRINDWFLNAALGVRF